MLWLGTIKMEKSHILNEQQVELAVQVAVKHIRKWTKTQLQKLLADSKTSKEKPLIVQLGQKAYLIGNYAIQEIDNYWHLIYRYSDTELVFQNRNAAMLYAVFQQTKKEALAEQIRKYDENINRLNIKAELFRLRLQQKRTSSNQKDLYSNRLIETRVQLKHNQFLLEKTLKLAKYYNF